MCFKVNCAVCQKATWQGCGQHIDSALAGVADADRCPGWRTGKHEDATAAAAPPQKQ
ncbi:hypothetical protein SDRG_09476 [Saprolegnia diclina VS20]|uniref:Uncharacterized protein n=2 Tax=Saprolegnia TaxID=4769 RepID=A0A067CBU3_SAPPC|nr:hypothetical protein SDRG_09476 [Saprolegnia diclina VS20]XP_012202782.1 hypothetical protein SPRG_08049 [Saprolegnia parasitica CBS 223.65]EQC32947.1 hypothetical protein SDRG_09476 [Saprolegnia diclina VS20]KDO26645.1 hypothetical protein SPRG_08049 [Saprolegnia parasitica CBS 223.65]|eukprot:XP_008613633.1 hypothetical protein SDRG_09476 [Saprolegnia diclina VS20]